MPKIFSNLEIADALQRVVNRWATGIPGAPQNAIQRLFLSSGVASGGFYQIKFPGSVQTAGISSGATALFVKSRIEGLPEVGPGDVSVTGPGDINGGFDVEFIGALAQTALPTMVVHNNAMTGSPPPVLAIETTQEGGPSGLEAANLRLFRNDIQPTPATAIDDLIEANFDGYAAVSLHDDFGTVAKVADGHYESLSNPHQYDAPGSGSGNTLFGWYVELAGNLAALERFTEAIPFTVGSQSFAVRLRVSNKSESLFLLE